MKRSCGWQQDVQIFMLIDTTTTSEIKDSLSSSYFPARDGEFGD